MIVEVQQAEVTAPADIQKQVDAARKADRKNVLMLIQREGGVQYVPLSLTKSPTARTSSRVASAQLVLLRPVAADA